jgi:excisionase family DNA binding protein
MTKKSRVLAYNTFGLSKQEAARYVGVPAAIFEAMVLDGRMPKPKAIGEHRLWSRASIRAAFVKLPEAGDNPQSLNPWDDCE